LVCEEVWKQLQPKCAWSKHFEHERDKRRPHTQLFDAWGMSVFHVRRRARGAAEESDEEVTGSWPVFDPDMLDDTCTSLGLLYL
jgi:hypothetical protein